MAKNNRNPSFKDYHQGQAFLLPPTFDDLIPQNHAVRVVSSILDRVDLEALLKSYDGGGASSYHPRMLLKVLVYGYLCNIYSTRKLEEATSQNIHFMWLSGMSTPDHNTIARFRTGKLKVVCKQIFTQVVLMLVESGHVDLKQVYTDGTKIESRANRYTFVWGKAIKTSRKRIASQLEELWNYAEQMAQDELKESRPESFGSLTPEQVDQTLDRIHKAIKDKPIDSKKRQKVNYAKKNWPDKLREYDQKEDILGERNSYSKTDSDATFMRMKEDHMLNGQLKPGYNVQVTTVKGQFIAHYSIHHNPTDTLTLIPHLEGFKQAYGYYPQVEVADAGYGSEENLNYLNNNNIDAYVKHNYFDREQKEGVKALSEYHPDNLPYDADQDCFQCPAGKKLVFIGSSYQTTASGYKRTLSKYQSTDCEGCPLRAKCHKGEGNRIIEVSHLLRNLRKQATERLLTEEGVEHRKRRVIEAEGTFGNIKGNHHFRRFLTCGKGNVSVEVGLLALAQNLRKLASLS